MDREHRISIAARLEQIEVACDFVAELAESANLDDDSVYHCRLSVEEVCTNVIEHGYEGDKPSKSIEVVCSLGSRYFSVTIIDDAPLFNPLSLPDPDPATPLWEREGGGWGVYFVKKYMDRVVYSNHKQRNHFTMEKLLEPNSR